MMKRDETMNRAMEEFIERRVVDCGMREHLELQESYARQDEAKDKLETTLNGEQRKLLRSLLNSYSLSDGETMQVYYRAGFADAMRFVLVWCGGLPDEYAPDEQ